MSATAEALAAELRRPPRWMYEWDLGEAGTPPLLGPELPSIHATRLDLIERPVREALEEAGPGATALDLGCSEGWFAHRLLEWGAARVVGVDLRGQTIARAALVRDHLGVPEERLSFVQADVSAPEAVFGRFDIVLALGLIYHLEDPTGFLRRAHAMTRRLCIVESQLTRQGPVTHGCGSSGNFGQAGASFAAVIEPDSTQSPVGSGEGVMALIPNRAAVEMAVRAAGFGRVEWQPTDEHHNEQFRFGDRGVLVARRVPSEGRATWLDFPGVTGRIHPNDDILYLADPRAEHYARSGRSAVEAIGRALDMVGLGFEDLESCLDLACGYGRVLRHLRRRIPPERITACDVMPEAVAFCSYEFGARPLLSDPHFEGVPFESYDLIWVGSLVTHLDEELFGEFCRLLPEILAPGGVLLITTLGDFAITEVSRYEARLNTWQDELEAAYRERGFAFVSYEDRSDGLGYSWHSSDFLSQAVRAPFGGSLELLAAEPRGWDGHQDVHAFRRG